MGKPFFLPNCALLLNNYRSIFVDEMLFFSPYILYADEDIQQSHHTRSAAVFCQRTHFFLTSHIICA